MGQGSKAMALGLNIRTLALVLCGLAIGETVVDQVFSGRAQRNTVTETIEFKFTKVKRAKV
jgi:hypothetical protein